MDSEGANRTPKRLNRLLLAVLIVLLWLIPAFALFGRGYVDSFYWSELSDAALGNSKGSLQNVSLGNPAYVIQTFTLAVVLGIPAQTVAILPIGGIASPILYFITSRRLLKSTSISLLLATYICYDFTLSHSEYNTFAYAWTHPLFLTYLFFLVRYLSGRAGSQGFTQALMVIPLFATFLTTYYFHPTYAYWIIILTAGCAIIVGLTRVRGAKNIRLRTAGALALSLIVLEFGFDEIFYRTFIGRAIFADPSLVSGDFVTLLESFLGLSVQASGAYEFIEPPPTALIGISLFLRTLVISVVLLGSIIWWLKRNQGRYRTAFGSRSVMASALVLTGIGHTVGYALYGHVSLRFIVFIFPIVGFLGLLSLGVRRRAVLVALLLVGLGAIQTGSSYLGIPPRPTALDQAQEPANWLIKYGNEQPSILSDFESSQVTRFLFSQNGQGITQYFYDEQTYGALVEGDKLPSTIEYLVVSTSASSVQSPGWVTFRPLSEFQSQIGQNTHLSLVYSDGTTWILVPIQT